MVLTEKQIIDLNRVCKQLSMDKLSAYASNGTITMEVLEKLTNLPPDRKAALKAIINKPKPNEREQKEWADMVPSLPNKDEALLEQLKSYIANWESSLPLGNHVEEARKLKDEIVSLQEAKEWEAVDKTDISCLIEYLNGHPDTSHKDEIDDLLWNHVQTIPDPQNQKNAAKAIIRLIPSSKHLADLNTLIASLSPVIIPPVDTTPLPAEIRSLSIIMLWQWLKDNARSEHYDKAYERFLELKAKEFQTMRDELSTYSGDRVFVLLEEGIITEAELFNQELATPQSLKILKEREEILKTLPEVNTEIKKCKAVCAENSTDVFLFGIPSTGKTCILMGLIGSPNININTVRAGGPYACVLGQFLDAGLTIGQTPKDFVATIQADIRDNDKKYSLNLIEMAGEDFAFKIADNPDGIVSFEDMGAGVTDLLLNKNKKAFFIIVDPTAQRVAFNYLSKETDEKGNVRTYLIRRTVDQKIILKRLVDLLSLPENKKILKNVKSINVIVTKADLLGRGQEREEEATRRFVENYKSIMNSLIMLCTENKINLRMNLSPMLLTFSLGKFYVGGVYQYDPTDANNLIVALKYFIKDE